MSNDTSTHPDWPEIIPGVRVHHVTEGQATSVIIYASDEGLSVAVGDLGHIDLDEALALAKALITAAQTTAPAGVE